MWFILILSLIPYCSCTLFGLRYSGNFLPANSVEVLRISPLNGLTTVITKITNDMIPLETYFDQFNSQTIIAGDRIFVLLSDCCAIRKFLFVIDLQSGRILANQTFPEAIRTLFYDNQVNLLFGLGNVAHNGVYQNLTALYRFDSSFRPHKFKTFEPNLVLTINNGAYDQKTNFYYSVMKKVGPSQFPLSVRLMGINTRSGQIIPVGNPNQKMPTLGSIHYNEANSHFYSLNIDTPYELGTVDVASAVWTSLKGSTFKELSPLKMQALSASSNELYVFYYYVNKRQHILTTIDLDNGIVKYMITGLNWNWDTNRAMSLFAN